MTNKEQVIGKIEEILNPLKICGVANIDVAIKIVEELESLGYVQPKVSKDLEQSITDLATMLSEEKDIVDINRIYNAIKNWLSANRYIQKAGDQQPKINEIVEAWCLCNVGEMSPINFFCKVNDILDKELATRWDSFNKERYRIKLIGWRKPKKQRQIAHP